LSSFTNLKLLGSTNIVSANAISLSANSLTANNLTTNGSLVIGSDAEIKYSSDNKITFNKDIDIVGSIDAYDCNLTGNLTCNIITANTAIYVGSQPVMTVENLTANAPLKTEYDSSQNKTTMSLNVGKGLTTSSQDELEILVDGETILFNDSNQMYCKPKTDGTTVGYDAEDKLCSTVNVDGVTVGFNNYGQLCCASGGGGGTANIIAQNGLTSLLGADCTYIGIKTSDGDFLKINANDELILDIATGLTNDSGMLKINYDGTTIGINDKNELCCCAGSGLPSDITCCNLSCEKNIICYGSIGSNNLTSNNLTSDYLSVNYITCNNAIKVELDAEADAFRANRYGVYANSLTVENRTGGDANVQLPNLTSTYSNGMQITDLTSLTMKGESHGGGTFNSLTANGNGLTGTDFNVFLQGENNITVQVPNLTASNFGVGVENLTSFNMKEIDEYGGYLLTADQNGLTCNYGQVCMNGYNFVLKNSNMGQGTSMLLCTCGSNGANITINDKDGNQHILDADNLSKLNKIISAIDSAQGGNFDEKVAKLTRLLNSIE